GSSPRRTPSCVAAWGGAHGPTVGPMMGGMAAPPRPDLGEGDLVLSDVGQARAVHAAVYWSARVAGGLGTDRADQVAAHAAAHLVGQLRAYGYRLSVEWVSVEARVALEKARGTGVGPDVVDPNALTWLL